MNPPSLFQALIELLNSDSGGGNDATAQSASSGRRATGESGTATATGTTAVSDEGSPCTSDDSWEEALLHVSVTRAAALLPSSCSCFVWLALVG
jgi:hypothetical protein